MLSLQDLRRSRCNRSSSLGRFMFHFTIYYDVSKNKTLVAQLDRPPRSCRDRGRGRSSGRSSLSTVISPDSPPVSFPCNNAFPRFMYQFKQNYKNVVGDESTTVLPLVSNMDGPAGTIFIGLIDELQHFIQVQWEHHRDMRVSGWAAPYHNRMADWVTKYRKMYPPQRHFM
ncbi:hypothetical protein M9H77_36010 [Catharanthus roseus]|uniref:Uncharacterized protein n=1 Tax=Catharanthus roseus TaxID=4058 RepID=A0ACB9ZUB8_CATRO|nr:hypothetical protein M9H77_36010 [Catharanthus roseus]